MPVRVTVLFNRTDSAGWSESYYSSQADVGGAIRAFQPVLKARQGLLASYCYVFAVRYTVLFVRGQSQLVIATTPSIGPSGAGGLNALNPDDGVVGALGTFTGGGRTERRLIRGLPDDSMEWSVPLGRMSFSVTSVGPLVNFATVLTSAGAGMGWLQRSVINGAGTNTQPISAVAAQDNGNALITIASNTPYDPTAGTAMVLSGFRGPAAVLNGPYGFHQYSKVATTQLNVTHQISAGEVAAYPGQGAFIRQGNYTFVPYTPTTTGAFSLVRSRKIGRPFGSTHGRRRVPR